MSDANAPTEAPETLVSEPTGQPLQSPRFDPAREAYQDKVDAALAEIRSESPEQQSGSLRIGAFGSINVQPSYGSSHPIGYPGMPATMVSWDADSYIVDKALGASLIPFGVAVSIKGASLTDGSQRSIILGGTAAACVGVTYRDITQLAMPSGLDGYPSGWTAGVMTRGDIWVQVTGAVDVTAAVKFDTATGRFGPAGTITLANARWMRGAAQNGDLALLRINFPSTV